MPIHFNITGGASKFDGGNDTIQVFLNQTIQNQINTALERTEGLTQNKLMVSNEAGILSTSNIASDGVLEKTSNQTQVLSGNLQTPGLTISKDDTHDYIVFKNTPISLHDVISAHSCAYLLTSAYVCTCAHVCTCMHMCTHVHVHVCT